MEWFDIIKWWLVLEIIGFAAVPLTAWIFRNLDDKGVSLSKIMGILLVTYFSWILPHIGFNYSTMIVGISVFIVLTLSLIIFSFKGYPFDHKELARSEVMFAAAFLFFVIVRAYQPGILGAEKFMDMSFINMILRSTAFPPMDPWLSGEPMQYYYFGYLVIANLIKLSGMLPTIGFNLGVATMFALSVSAAYGLGRTLTRSRIFGVVTMAFVVIFGNLAGFIQLLVILFIPKYYTLFNVPSGDVLTRLGAYYYWPTSRVIPFTINEFPYFSFIHADLHAHMIGIAFQLLMLAMLYNLLREGKEYNIPALAAIALLLGFMFPLNSWDYPTYAIFFVIVLLAWRVRVFAMERKAEGLVDRLFSLSPVELAKTVLVGSAVGIGSLVLYIPYYIGPSVPHSLKIVTYGQTLLPFYLGVFGIALFFIIIYSISCFYDSYYPDMRIVLAGLAAAVVAAYLTNIQILIIVLPLIFMSAYSLLKSEDPRNQYIHLLILLGALLSLFCELFYIQDSFGTNSPDYIRFNTVFKVYIQHWIVWGLAAGLCLHHLWQKYIEDDVPNKVFAITSVVLILAGITYPVFATYSRSGGFEGEPALDGAKFLEQRYVNEYNAIQWLNNLSGTPVVLQSPGYAYKMNTHVTAFTGLPAVIGWAGHEMNWRNRAETISERWSEVNAVYTSDDLDEVNGILDKYNVDYIYVGGVEEERYGGHDVRELFEDNPGRFELMYFNSNVHIYKVVRQ